MAQFWTWAGEHWILAFLLGGFTLVIAFNIVRVLAKVVQSFFAIFHRAKPPTVNITIVHEGEPGDVRVEPDEDASQYVLDELRRLIRTCQAAALPADEPEEDEDNGRSAWDRLSD